MRLPQGYERLEPSVRSAVSSQLSRGSVSVQLDLRRSTTSPAFQINEIALEAVIATAEDVRRRVGGPPLQAEQLLALRGVLETSDGTDPADVVERREAALLADLDRALEQLVLARMEEGERLRQAMAERIGAVCECVEEVAEHPARRPETIRLKLEAQLARLLESDTIAIDPARLAQEAALLATRADVDEEISRLRAHVESARQLLASDSPVGRRLDFLTQELNREANTLCSKSSDIALTEIGLRLKVLVDQIREQAQNIE